MKKILIIKLSALGDVLISSAAIQRIIESHSSDQICLLTTKSYAPLFDARQELNQALDIECLVRPDWLSIVRLGWHLRRRHFLRVYDLQGNKRSRMLTWLSRAPQRIGLWPGWPYSQGGSLPRRPRVHPFLRLNSALQAVGIPLTSECSPFPIHPDDQHDIQQWLQTQHLEQQNLILMHAGCSARWNSKRWPESRFLDLAKHLQAQGFRVIWLGGPDDRALNARLSQQVGLNACDAFSIPGLIALAQHACFAMTNDSGPMHALAAANIPVYSLFGPTDWRLSHALGQRERVIHSGVSCSPCFKSSCPLQNEPYRCMTSIQVKDVMARLRSDGLLAADARSDTSSDTAVELSAD